LDLFGALGGDALAEFATVGATLEQEIGSLLGQAAAPGWEALAAEGTAAKPLDGLHLPKDVFTLLEEIGSHADMVSI
jgi:hypothetical protein